MTRNLDERVEGFLGSALQEDATSDLKQLVKTKCIPLSSDLLKRFTWLSEELASRGADSNDSQLLHELTPLMEQLNRMHSKIIYLTPHLNPR